jgi:hypothetical protein
LVHHLNFFREIVHTKKKREKKKDGHVYTQLGGGIKRRKIITGNLADKFFELVEGTPPVWVIVLTWV